MKKNVKNFKNAKNVKYATKLGVWTSFGAHNVKQDQGSKAPSTTSSVNQANNDDETPLKRATEEGHIGSTSSSFFFHQSDLSISAGAHFGPIRLEHLSIDQSDLSISVGVHFGPIRLEY